MGSENPTTGHGQTETASAEFMYCTLLAKNVV